MPLSRRCPANLTGQHIYRPKAADPSREFCRCGVARKFVEDRPVPHLGDPKRRIADAYLEPKRWSQKKLIVYVLKALYPEWVPAYRLRGRKVIIEGLGYRLGHQADRRCRELANEGAIRSRIEGGFAEYAYPEE